MTRDDGDDPEEGLDREPGDEDVSSSADEVTQSPGETRRHGSGQARGFQLPAGFAPSLLATLDGFPAQISGPWQEQMQGNLKALLPDTSAYARGLMEPLNRRLQEQMKSALPDYDALAKKVLEPYNDQLRAQMASIAASIPTFSAPMIDLPALKSIGFGQASEAMLKQIAEQRSTMLEGLRASLRPLFDPKLLRGFNRALLPPNLREHADEIRAHEVLEFLEQEGIPLYLVPRGRTALRLLRAEDRSSRRRVLGDCYESLIVDCAAVLERAHHEGLSDEVRFALDGLGAMRAGHTCSAQAMFTVTLDTLIYRVYTDRTARGTLTNRPKDAGVPDAIDEMGVSEAMVWLSIWNAHEQFWQHKGDKVPHYYSRHASVHGVSSRQFSKRNCVQVLMLVTSLIGYADQITRRDTRTSA